MFLSDNHNDRHKEFWTTDRTGQLRDVFNSWAIATEGAQTEYLVKIQKLLASRCGLVVSTKPSSKNLTRFKEGAALSQDVIVKSAIAEFLFQHCDNNTLSGLEVSDFETIRRLYMELKQETSLKYPSKASAEDPTIDTERLVRSLNVINDPLEDNDPDYPEFPSLSPKFPASRLEQLRYGDFTIYVKDESTNLTGSHKDRWAREIMLDYKREILGLIQRNKISHRSDLPVLGVISSGSAALALQAQLRLSELPNLRVVVDGKRISQRMLERLKDFGCVVRAVELDKAYIESHGLPKIFKEKRRIIDVSPRDLTEVISSDYYDWLAAEILDENPDVIIVPVGSGVLYASILSFIENLDSEKSFDKRLRRIDLKDTRMIKVIGATSTSSTTRMDKLFAKHRPIVDELHGYISNLAERKIIHPESEIYEVAESSAENALTYAKHAKISSEPSGIAGLGLAIELIADAKISIQEKVVVVNTGRFFYGWSR